VQPDGSGIGEQVFAANGKLLARADLRGDGRIDALFTSAASVSGRYGFVPVYSRSSARVFLLGGVDGAGTPIKDVWVRHLDGSQWQSVPPGGYDAGNILAATYSHADRRLWILDEIVAAPTPTPAKASKAKPQLARRIVRLDPDTGQADVLGSWPRLSLFDAWWLRTDRDGSMLLFASSSTTKQHAVVRLVVRKLSLESAGVRVGSGRLAQQPVVDMAGYWLIVEQAQGAGPRAARLTDLTPTNPGWVHQAKTLTIEDCL
jgi:hypothetical protein